MNNSRVVTGFFFSLFFCLFIFFGGFLYTAFITVISIITLMEFYKLTVDDIYNYSNLVLLFVNLVCTVFLNVLGLKYLHLLLPFYFLVVILCTVLTFSRSNKVVYCAMNQIVGYIYISLSFTFLLEIRSHHFGLLHSLMLYLLVAVGDVGAYYFGTIFGRYKLVPAISYNKTVEGSVSGFLACLLFAAILWLFFNNYCLCDFLFFNFMLFAFFIGFFAQIGDLFASVIKRIAKVKDSGTLLPGHGGLLDRMDSLLLSSFFGYFCFCVLEII